MIAGRSKREVETLEALVGESLALQKQLADMSENLADFAAQLLREVAALSKEGGSEGDERR